MAADDKEKIQELLAKYALSLDTDDVAACVGLFMEDGYFEVYDRRFEGHDGLTRMMTSAPHGLHLAGAAMIDIDGSSATVQQQLLFIEAATQEMRLCVYDDVVVLHEGQWKFRSRRSRFMTAEGLMNRPKPKAPQA